MPVGAATETSGRPVAPWRVAAASSAIGKAAEMVTLLGLATVVPRALGPDDYGEFSVALTIVTLGSLALVLGGPTTMARFVPAAAPADRIALARRLGLRLAVGRAAQVGALAVAAVLAVLIAPDRFPPLITAAVIVALALNVVASLGLQIGLGLGRAGPWSARFPLQNFVLILAVLVLYPVADERGAAVALVVAGAAAAGLGLVVAQPVLASPARDVAVPAHAIRFGQLHATGSALTQVAHRGGVVAVAILAGARSGAEAGYTSLALGIALGATYAVLQTFTVAMPHLVGDDRRSISAAERVMQRLAAVALALLVPGCAAVALTLGTIVPVVFGDGYADAVTTFGPALALVVLAPLNALVVQAAALRVRPGVSVGTGAAAAVAFVITALVLIPAHGAPGGTAAALAAVAASALVGMALLPGAVPRRLGAASFGGAAVVLVLGIAT